MTDYLGIDIKLDEDGDIMWNYKDDFVMVSGTNNLSQSIVNRLKTAVGELTLHEFYGSEIPNTIGQLNNLTYWQELRSNIRECLKQEPRINAINKISINRKSLQELEINIEITPINSNTTLNIVYPLFLTS